MARLTSELATHKALLDELRTLREADKNTLRQKVREVDLLRREVEKIAGEVEVLKGVVEEGLRERRERSLSNSHDGSQDHGLDASLEGNIGNAKAGKGRDEDEDRRPNFQQDADDYEIEDVQPALARRALLERTIRMTRQLLDPLLWRALWATRDAMLTMTNSNAFLWNSRNGVQSDHAHRPDWGAHSVATDPTVRQAWHRQ
jgi:hypothetical protein